MTDQQTGKKKGAVHAGRNRDKCARYKLANRRAQNKFVRVAKSNGHDRALEYAAAHGLSRQWAEKRLSTLPRNRAVAHG